MSILKSLNNADYLLDAFSGESLESSFGALTASLCPPSNVRDQHRESSGSEGSNISQSRQTPPKMEGKNSFFSRWGFSLRKKIRRLSNETSRKDHPSPPSRSSSKENLHEGSAVRHRFTEVSSPRSCSVDTAVGAGAAFGLIPEETAETPVTSPYKTSTPSGARGESMESDSGIIVNKLFEKTISFDSTTGNKSEFDTDSSKHSSSKSKQDSLKKREVKRKSPPAVNVEKVSSPESPKDSNGSTTIQELEQVFYKQGLEPKGFSHSTLV